MPRQQRLQGAERRLALAVVRQRSPKLSDPFLLLGLAPLPAA
jgi:hypothetical protein